MHVPPKFSQPAKDTQFIFAAPEEARKIDSCQEGMLKLDGAQYHVPEAPTFGEREREAESERRAPLGGGKRMVRLCPAECGRGTVKKSGHQLATLSPLEAPLLTWFVCSVCVAGRS